MKVWMIVLKGQGDTDVKIVDEATFKWVTSEDMGKPEGTTSNGWLDTLVPESQKKLMRAATTYGKPTDEVELTSGSWWNDRMLAACGLPGYEGENMWSLRDALRIVKRRGDEIEDTVEGEIY